MSLPSSVPHGSASSADPSPDGHNSETANHPAIASADEETVRAVNDLLSSATTHPRHPDPRSGLLESHILPVIYTKYHFEDCKLGFLQYTSEMVEKHQAIGITLKKGDIAIYWVIQVRREYPDGHPLRQILMEQMDTPEIQLFWQRQIKRSSKDKNLLRTLKERVKKLNKKVKLLNQQIAQMHKEHDKPVEENNGDKSRDVSDHLSRVKLYDPASKQLRKRKRGVSVGGYGRENENWDAQEDDRGTEKKTTANAIEKARKEESKASAQVEQYASEGASVPYAPRALTSGELAVHSEFTVDDGEEKKGG
ncbi:hypothetical protein BDR22DRAFT_889909 [Usnea florida]